MKIQLPSIHPPGRPENRRRRGYLEVDMIIAMLILTIAIVPLAYSFARERRVLHVEYFRAVAGEIVDGEMEILAAGAARDLPDGTQIYTVHSHAAASLPPGHFQLTKTGSRLRLEWTPDEKRGVSAVAREATLK